MIKETSYVKYDFSRVDRNIVAQYNILYSHYSHRTKNKMKRLAIWLVNMCPGKCNTSPEKIQIKNNISFTAAIAFSNILLNKEAKN